MEFWGVEVPSGKPFTCEPGPASYIHVSQAALGEVKGPKGHDRVVLKVKVGKNEVVVGTLAQGKCDQTTLDLIFEKDFVLSHNSSGSVYFCGYKTDAVRDDDSMSSGSEDDEFDLDDDEDDDEEEKPTLLAKENGKVVSTKPDKVAIPAIMSAPKSPPKVEVPVTEKKSKVKSPVAEKGKGLKLKSDDDDEDDEDDEDADEEDSDEDDEMMGSGSDDDDLDSGDSDASDDESSEEEEPKLPAKKRPASTPQAASAGKKIKAELPGKAEPKTPSVAVSTPKQKQSGKKDQSAKKTPGKENANTPASGKKLGQFFCQPCSKNFNSESALSQHKTAKHKA